MLRSLDAIHLASALLIRAEFSSFVAYDPSSGHSWESQRSLSSFSDRSS